MPKRREVIGIEGARETPKRRNAETPRGNRDRGVEGNAETPKCRNAER